MILPSPEGDPLVPSASLGTLPAVYRPGTHAGPHGVVEVSTAMFCDDILDHIPDAAFLFRMGEVVGHLSGPVGAMQFVALDPDGTRLLVDRHVRIVACQDAGSRGGIQTTYLPCGKDLAGLILAAARGSPRVRELRAVVNYPVFLPGFIRAVPGYNECAAVYYDEPEGLRGLASAEAAPLGLLDDILEGFPFREEASRENALALLLTLALRFALDGNVPGFLVRAHRERTGKTLLVRTGCVAVTGEEPALLQFGATEEEREKRITAALLKGRTVLVLDNLPAGEEIDSGALAMLLTTRVWSGRVLGHSRTPSLPNEMTVVLTGNNLGASGEIAQRLVPIHLAAASANPQDRTEFPHEDPVAHARAHRRHVQAAILSLVEQWKARGCPPFRGVGFGGFEGWTRVIGGILTAAGSRAFLGNLRAWQDSADEFGADAAALLADWAQEESLGAPGGRSAPVQAKAIYQRAERLDLFSRFRQGASEPARSATFGKRVLGVLVDRIVRARWGQGGEEVCIDVRVRRSTSGSNSLYTLEVAP